MVGGVSQRHDLGDGIYFELENEELMMTLVANNLYDNIRSIKTYNKTGEKDWIVDSFLEEGKDINEVLIDLECEFTIRKEAIEKLLVEEKEINYNKEDKNLKKLEGEIYIGKGYVNIQPTKEQWLLNESGILDIKDLSSIDKIGKVSISDNEQAKISYQLSNRNEDGNYEYSKVYQAIGKEATSLFLASEKKEPVKVILKETEYEKKDGTKGVSYQSIAVENLAQNKVNLLDYKKDIKDPKVKDVELDK